MSLQTVDISSLGRNTVATFVTGNGHEFTAFNANGYHASLPFQLFILNNKKVLIQTREQGERNKLTVTNDISEDEVGTTIEPETVFTMPSQHMVTGVYCNNVLYYSYDFSAFYSLSGQRLAVTDKIPWDDTDHVTANSRHYFYCIDKQRKIVAMDVDGNIVAELTLAAELGGDINDIIACEDYLMVGMDNYRVLVFNYLTGQLTSTYTVPADTVTRIEQLKRPMFALGQYEDYIDHDENIAAAIKDSSGSIHFLVDNIPKKPLMTVYDNHLILAYHWEHRVAPIALKINNL